MLALLVAQEFDGSGDIAKAIKPNRRKAKTKAKKQEIDLKRNRIEQIKAEIRDSLKREKDKDSKKENPKGQKKSATERKEEEYIDDKLKGKSRIKAKGVYSTSTPENTASIYGAGYQNPEDLYLYKTDGKNSAYTMLNFGDNPMDINYKDVEDMQIEKRRNTEGFTFGTGKYISIEKKERYKLHQLIGYNVAMSWVAYDMALK